jgi:hypothetical protein
MIAVLVSLLFLLASGLAPQAGIEARPDVRHGAEQEASTESDPEVFVRSRRSRAARLRQARKIFPVHSARAEAEHFRSAAAIKDLSLPLKLFSPDLTTLKRAFRL